MNVVIECRQFTKYVDTFSPFTIAFSFSTNEAKENYFYQKVNLRAASQVAERLKTGPQKIGKLYDNIRTSCKHNLVPILLQKRRNLAIVKENSNKSAIGFSTESRIFLNFANLYQMFANDCSKITVIPGARQTSVNLQ